MATGKKGKRVLFSFAPSFKISAMDGSGGTIEPPIRATFTRKTAKAFISRGGGVEFLGENSGKFREVMEKAEGLIFSKGKIKEAELYSALGEYDRGEILMALVILERSGKIASRRSFPVLGGKYFEARYVR
jgi:hypothetical protein